jgi:hypothetical protein
MKRFQLEVKGFQLRPVRLLVGRVSVRVSMLLGPFSLATLAMLA